MSQSLNDENKDDGLDIVELCKKQCIYAKKVCDHKGSLLGLLTVNSLL